MSRSARHLLVTLICLVLIGVVYMMLPASFYTVSALLLGLALISAIRALRA